MKIKYSLSLFLLLCSGSIYAQTKDTTSKARYFSIGGKHAGVCFGNSSKYTGLRFNFRDKNVNTISGLNFCFLFTKAQKSNGVSGGIFANADSTNIGLSFAGIANGGLVRKGVGVAGLFIVVDTLKGLFITTIKIGKIGNESSIFAIQQISGVAICFGSIVAEKIKGVSMSSINNSKEHHGLSIGLFNRTEKLRGVQVGLINYAGNNPRGLRWLPFINMHFGKTKAPK